MPGKRKERGGEGRKKDRSGKKVRTPPPSIPAYAPAVPDMT